MTASDFDEAASERAANYEGLGLLDALGRGLFTGTRIRQSVAVHLMAFPRLNEVPLPHRRDLRALDGAGALAAKPLDVAKKIASIIPGQDVKAGRRALISEPFHSFMTLLGTSASISASELLQDARDAAALTEWRRSAIAWLTTATKTEVVERHVARAVVPYVLAHLPVDGTGWTDEVSMRRADALALARVHHATRDMRDAEVYALIENFQRLGHKEVFGAASAALNGLADPFLIAFRAELERLVSTGQ